MDRIELTDIELLEVETESSHPLENVVLSAYERKIKDGIENPSHNESSLFSFFTDATLAQNGHDIEYTKAYKRVIEDVLDYMERNGKLYRDENGCFLQPEAPNPDDPRAYINRGIAYARQDNLDMAMADFNKAIALNPNDAEAYNYRGKAYMSAKNFDNAIEDFSRAIALNPDNPTFYHNRGMVFQEAGDENSATADFLKAERLGGLNWTPLSSPK